MYYKMLLEDKVRVPPQRLGDKLEKVILEVLQEQLEGSIDKELGIFICVKGVHDVGEGEIVPGDGGVYYNVKFEAMVLRLGLQEVIEGLVVETTSFGAFVSLGPIDAMLHVSQISDEYINFDEKNNRLNLPGIQTVHRCRRHGSRPCSDVIAKRAGTAGQQDRSYDETGRVGNRTLARRRD